MSDRSVKKHSVADNRVLDLKSDATARDYR